MLAFQIGFDARFDQEGLEVDTRRYFVDGESDAFEDQSLRTVQNHHLQELGFFLLPSQRTWDRAMSFSSELFKKIVALDHAKPGEAVLALRDMARAPSVELEKDSNFKSLVGRLDAELARFLPPHEASLRFLLTTTDTDGILRSLTPHLVSKAGTDASSIPIGRNGSGVVSLQTILLLLELGRARHEAKKPFLLVAEEPELHLHPGHHRRLVGRIRGVTTQSIVTTHSPEVAAYYKPCEIVVLTNFDGAMKATSVGRAAPDPNALMRLYTVYRAEMCEALMHDAVIVPEGMTEFHWFHGLARILFTAEGWTSADDDAAAAAIGVLPTQDGSVVKTATQFLPLVARLLPLVDGDAAGQGYVAEFEKHKPAFSRVARLGNGLTLESVVAWILFPLKQTQSLWDQLVALIPGAAITTRDELASAIAEKCKRHWSVHEDLLWLLKDCPEALTRARNFLAGLNAIAAGAPGPLHGWSSNKTGSTEVWVWEPAPERL
jgi:hypothetical protein